MNKYSYCFLIAFYLIISSCDLFTEPDVKNSPTEHILSNFDANIVDSFDWEKSSFNLESHNNILYSHAWKTDEIVRYDLNANTFLESRPAPSGECANGFEIVEGRFYYSDWDAILSIPLEDIEN